MNVQNSELDSKNIQDYGLPFNDLLADPANPYGYAELPAYDGEFVSEYNPQEQSENSQLDDYYRKYLDDPKNKLFDMDNTDEACPKSEFMTKKFPFCVKSDICLVNSLSNTLKEPQMPSLLYRIQPRYIILHRKYFHLTSFLIQIYTIIHYYLYLIICMFVEKIFVCVGGEFNVY